MPDDAALRYLIVFTSKYMFKCLDILFKFVGWFLFVIALRVLSSQVDSKLLSSFVFFMHSIYFFGLSLSAFLLIFANRKEIGLPEDRLGMVLAVIVKIVGVTLLLVMVSPTFPLDHIVNRLIEMKISK